MRSLIPFDGLFGNTVLDHFFDDDMPTVYQDYTAVPKVDIEDKKDHYEITCDMPGFKKEDISLTYDNNYLTIATKHADSKDEKDEKGNFVRRERSTSSMSSMRITPSASLPARLSFMNLKV